MSDSQVAPLEDEPKTPMWLPALGAALFVAVALWWAVTPSAAPIAPDTAASASAPVATAAPPPQAAPTAQPIQAARPMGSARPGASTGVDPKVQERMKRLHEQIELKPPGGGQR